MPTSTSDPTVASVRAFNRYYTRAFGFLSSGLDGSPFPLTEARILYEMAHGTDLTAAEIERRLGVDKGQLSRIVAKFRRAGLLRSEPSPAHARHRFLRLTSAGRRAFAALNRATDHAISARLAPLTAGDRTALAEAMARITTCLAEPSAAPAAVCLRDPVPGDLGHVVHRQARLYAEEYGWDWTYEALIARILADFIDGFDPAHEQAWIAERDGAIMGSIFLVKGTEPGVGKLRLLYVERAARGAGIGGSLVRACIARAREVGYERLELWTNSVLVSARRLYEAAGFVLVDQRPHHSFGQDLVGQTWRLVL